VPLCTYGRRRTPVFNGITTPSNREINDNKSNNMAAIDKIIAMLFVLRWPFGTPAGKWLSEKGIHFIILNSLPQTYERALM
jgi:hypothetical protein